MIAATLAGLFVQAKGRPKTFLQLWLLAAAAGFLSVPHFVGHYLLPALVPLSVAAAPLFARPPAGRPVWAALVLWSCIWYQPWDRAWQMHIRASTEELTAAAVLHAHGRGVLVFDGPTAVYTLGNLPFPTPLVFPHHLNMLTERNVSQFDTDAEVARVLARHPGAVVSTLLPRNYPVNWVTWNAVQAYVHTYCRPSVPVQYWGEVLVTPMMVWGDCAPAPQDRTPA